MRARLSVVDTKSDNPQICMLCGCNVFSGARVETGFIKGIDGARYRFSPMVCFDCISDLGAMAGYACAGMGVGATNDERLLEKLTLGYWQGLATARDEMNLKLCVEMGETSEEIETLKEEVENFQQITGKITNRPGKNPGYVYLMRRQNGDCKIGLSEDVDRRHDQIRRDFPGTSLLNWFDCDDMRTAERILHDEFCAKRRDGEWFTLDPDEIDYLMTIGKYERGEFWRRAVMKNLMDRRSSQAPDGEEKPF